MPERHLRRPAVQLATGLSRSSIYDLMKHDKFPRPKRIGARAVAWSETDIIGWLASRPIANGKSD